MLHWRVESALRFRENFQHRIIAAFIVALNFCVTSTDSGALSLLMGASGFCSIFKRGHIHKFLPAMARN